MPAKSIAAGRLLPIIAVLASAAHLSLGQLRPTLIRDATILTGEGQELEKASLLIQGDKIGSLGTAIEGGFLTKKINARGKFITPGLIDVWSTLGLRTANANAGATARAADAWDRFDNDAIKAALAQGVTTIYVPASSREGLGGHGAVFRLIPGGSAADVLLKGDAAMCATLGGSSNQGAIGRIVAASNLRRAFEDAKQYREAQDFYKEDLEEYEKKIKERAEKEGTEKKDGQAGPEGPKDAQKDAPKPTPPARPARPVNPRRPRSADVGETVESDSAAVESGSPEESDAPLATNEQPPKPDDGKPGDEKKKDEIQKPVEPPRDAAKEALLKVLDGDLPLRVAADRPEDILNAIEIAEAFNLRLIVEGATGAHLVAERLAERETPVIQRASAPPQQFSGGVWRYYDPAGVATLFAAKVRVYCGSGPADGFPTRHLALNAARLVAQGMNPETALATITTEAAQLLGIDERTGKLAPGMAADLVIWSAHPLSPAARVERVFINGQEVYRATKADDKEDES